MNPDLLQLISYYFDESDYVRLRKSLKLDLQNYLKYTEPNLEKLLISASSYGDLELVKDLDSKGINSRSAIAFAMQMGHVEVLKYYDSKNKTCESPDCIWKFNKINNREMIKYLNETGRGWYWWKYRVMKFEILVRRWDLFVNRHRPLILMLCFAGTYGLRIFFERFA